MQQIVKLNHAFLYSCMVVLFCLSPLFTRSEPLQGKPLTISIKNTSLAEVLRQVSKKSGLYIYFQDVDLAAFPSVSIDVKNKSVDAVLHELLDGRGLTWVVVDKNSVAVRKKEVVSNDNYSDTTVTVRGKVVDEKGSPIIGATVMVKGTRIGTTTQADGGFVLRSGKGRISLVVSSVGYLTQEIILRNKLSEIITLKEYVANLDESVVIAYGVSSKRLLTGNVFAVKSTDIEKQPVSNPLLALAGRVPGLFITQSTGYAGTGVKVRIQGDNSIINGNDPLYVVDGVPYSSQLLPTMNGILGNSGTPNNQYFLQLNGNPLSYINPSDIESIEVLKDADATAIYGSRAANGAILITTKKGKDGKTTVDFNLQTGAGKIARKLNLLDASQYVAMRREALKNDGLTPDETRDYDLFNNFGWNPSKNTDWQKMLIGNTSHYTDLQSTVSGGNGNMQFLIGGNFKKETTVLPGDFSDKKGSLHFSINALSNDHRFQITLSGSYLSDYNQLPNYDITSLAITIPPGAPSLYNADGSINWASNTSGGSTWMFSGNPIAFLLNRYKNRTNNLVGNTIISYTLFQGLEIRSSFGYNKLTSEETQIYPLKAVLPEYRSFIPRSSDFANSHNASYIVEPQINYKRWFGKMKMDVLVGGTIQNNTSSSLKLSGINYTSDDVMEDLSTAANIQLQYSIKNDYKYNAFFGRFNLNWSDKYILNLTGRRDGSSRFGSQNLFHSFGSVGGAWLFSKEIFFSKQSILSFGKLKASYGTTGNDQIGDYRFLNLYGPVTGVLPYQGSTANLPTSLPNMYLQWEETKKMQFGLDLGFLNNRLYFTTTYFRNRSSNQLLEYNLPITTGFSSITSNFPATVQNSGWEFSVNTVNIRNKDISWTSNINLTIPKNKLIAFNSLSNSSYASRLVIGEPTTILKKFQYAGVDPATGEYQFHDAKGLLTSTPSDPSDNIAIIHTNPIFYGGFQNAVSFKGVTLDFLFQFVKQNGPNYKFGSLPGYFSGTTGNQPVSVLDHWEKTGDIKPIQRYNSDVSLGQQNYSASQSSEGYSDASYIRLKNISISWQLPVIVKKSIHVQDMQIYVHAQNILTITHYQGMDPETCSSNTLPPLKIITAGLRVTL